MGRTNSVAAQVLENLNVNLKEVRKEVLKELETFNLQLPPIGGTTMTPATPPPDKAVNLLTKAILAAPPHFFFFFFC